MLWSSIVDMRKWWGRAWAEPNTSHCSPPSCNAINIHMRHPSSPQKEEWEGRILIKPWNGIHCFQPFCWPRLNHLVQKTRAEAGKLSLSICPREKWAGFGEHMELSLCLRPFNPVLYFTDGRTEGLRLGDFQQVTWRFGDSQDKKSEFILSDTIVWGRKDGGEGRGEKGMGRKERTLDGGEERRGEKRRWEEAVRHP